jgi:PAS domain S-box-containing protein
MDINVKDIVENNVTSTLEHAVVASLVDGIVVNDLNGQVILINDEAARMFGVAAQEVSDQPVQALFESLFPRGHLAILDAMERLYADPYSYKPEEGATETTIEVGNRAINTHLSPLLTEAGEFLGIVTVLRDVTHEVEAERAKSEFVSNVSHELRRPLTAIKGYSDLLLFNAIGPLNEQQEHFLSIVQDNANRLVELANDLLDISHIETGRMELDIQPVKLGDIIRQVAEVMRPRCEERDLNLAINIQRNIGVVMGDKNRLAQVVTNLIKNASYNTPRGGHIKVDLSRSGNVARVDVADTGPGMSQEEKVKVFQRFYRVNNPSISKVAGTGLGMPIAKMLVGMHGGFLRVESELGEGSTFTVVLPLQSGVTAGVEDPVSPRPSDRPRTILVVEDEPDISELISLQLRSEGFDVLVTAKGEEALAIAQGKSIDLITLDMMLPDITGMEVLRRLKADAKTADIPVIVVSVIQPKVGGPAWGAADHISKPFALTKLLSSVRRTLAAVENGRLTPLTVVE